MPKKLSDLKFTRFTLLQTANSGAGKTTRTLSAVRFGPLYIMDFDQKAQGAARSIPAVLALPAGWQDKVEVDTFAEPEQALAKLKELALLGDKMPYATICVDTFTNLNEMVYVKAMGAQLEKGIKADYELWGKVDSFLVAFFNRLMSLPCNIIINAHVRSNEDELTKRVVYGQAGRGGFKDRLAGRVTDSHFLSLQFDKYQVRVKNSETLPVNTNIDPKYINKDGTATVFDLSIFDDYAAKKG